MPFQRAVPSSKLATAGSSRVAIGHRMVAVFRLDDGTLRAIPDACPHQEGALSRGMVRGHCVTCPQHQLVFDLDTGELTGDHDIVIETPVARIPVYPVEEHDGWIWVDVPVRGTNID